MTSSISMIQPAGLRIEMKPKQVKEFRGYAFTCTRTADGRRGEFCYMAVPGHRMSITDAVRGAEKDILKHYGQTVDLSIFL